MINFNKIKEDILQILRRDDDERKLSEDSAHDNFVKECCLKLADELYKSLLTKISDASRKKLNTLEDLDNTYDEQFQNNLVKINNMLVIDLPIIMDNKQAIIYLEFISTKINQGVAFRPNKKLNDRNVFEIVIMCDFLNDRIPLSIIRMMFNQKQYLVHEFAHLLLDKKTKGKASLRNEDKYIKYDTYCYNCPTEFNSHQKQLLVELDELLVHDRNVILALLNIRNDDTILDILKIFCSKSISRFLSKLNSINKRKIVQDTIDYIKYKLDKKESLENLPLFTKKVYNIYHNEKPKDCDITLYFSEWFY